MDSWRLLCRRYRRRSSVRRVETRAGGGHRDHAELSAGSIRLARASRACRRLLGWPYRKLRHDGPGPGANDFEVLLAAERILLAKSSRSFAPTEDGMLVKEDIAAGFGTGRQNRIPLIVGSNEDETVFGSEPDFNEELSLAGASVDELRRFYPEASRNLAELAARLYTDRVFTEPVRLVARSQAATEVADESFSSSLAPKACPAPECSRIATAKFQIF